MKIPSRQHHASMIININVSMYQFLRYYSLKIYVEYTLNIFKKNKMQSLSAEAKLANILNNYTTRD